MLAAASRVEGGAPDIEELLIAAEPTQVPVATEPVAADKMEVPASRNGASRSGASRNGASRHKLNLYLTIAFWDVPPTREALIEERFECLLCRRPSLLRNRLKRIPIGMGLK